MRALVTGATGFIGGHLVEGLLKEGCQVRCLVRSAEKAENLRRLGAEIAVGDIGNMDHSLRTFKDVETVFHAAAKVQDYGKWKDFESDTVLGTKNVLTAAVQCNVRRFIYLSTIGTYSRQLTAQSSDVINEADWRGCHINQLDYYCRAKRLAEDRVWDYHRRSQLKVTVIRPVTTYGPGDKPMFFRLAKALEEGEFSWIGNFDPVVGMLNVADLVDLCLRAAVNPEAIGKAYNAGPSQPVHLREFINLTCRELGLPYPRKTLPYSLAQFVSWADEQLSTHVLTRREPMMTRLLLLFLTKGNQRCSIAQAQRDLGWAPEVGLEQGIAEAVRSYQAHRGA